MWLCIFFHLDKWFFVGKVMKLTEKYSFHFLTKLTHDDKFERIHGMMLKLAKFLTVVTKWQKVRNSNI